MYTRLFESILDSSINVQGVPPSIRWLWVTMLMIADKGKDGIVDMPVERLAARAGLTLDQANEGLAVLSSPDPDSRSQLEEGRRIVPIRETGRGWKLVNWEEYKKIANETQRRERTRVRVAAFRDRRANDVTPNNAEVTKADASEIEGLDFDLHGSFLIAWRAYPRKRGKDEALRHYRAQVRTPMAHAELMAAIANYAKECGILATDEQFVMHGSTFFNKRWGEYVDGAWTPPQPPKRGVHGQGNGSASGDRRIHTGATASGPAAAGNGAEAPNGSGRRTAAELGQRTSDDVLETRKRLMSSLPKPVE